MHSFTFVTEMPERVQSSKELQREFFSFPNSLSAILYLSLALRFLHSTLFFLFFSVLLLSSTGALFFFFCLARWQANQSSFFLCPRRGFCMRRQDGGIHRIHKYARAPDTKKSPARRLQRFKTFTLQGAKDEAAQKVS